MGLNKRLISSDVASPPPVNTDNFDIVTYTGNGSTQSITSLDFEPDFLWIKARTDTYLHVIYDKLRISGAYAGVNLRPSFNYSEQTELDTLSSYNSDGFTVSSDGKVNGNTIDYVAWCFKGGGSAVSNTDGSITSQVSANTEAGFSIVKYTGTFSNDTFGHGLSQAPELIIQKRLDASTNWFVKDTVTGVYQTMNLNLTNSATTISGENPPTSQVISLSQSTNTNNSGSPHIAYCFHSVDGYQKVGSYTGASGLSLNLGFQPRFFMTKNADAAEAFAIYYYDGSQINLFFTTSSGTENTNRTEISFTSTGIDFNTTGGHFNQVGSDFVYLAIA